MPQLAGNVPRIDPCCVIGGVVGSIDRPTPPNDRRARLCQPEVEQLRAASWEIVRASRSKR
jgi:hypothetical protein